MANFPTSLDDNTSLVTAVDNNTVVMAAHHNNLKDAVVATETKIGTGSSTPTSGKLLKGDGAGSSSWANLSASDIPDISATYAPAAKGVTNGDSHDHNGGDGGQVDHVNLANKGTNTHAQIDTHIGAANPHSGSAASGANTDITSVFLNNTGLKVKDTNASHGLTLKPGSDLTADKTLTLTTGDADRTLTLTGDASITGTNTGDQVVPANEGGAANNFLTAYNSTTGAWTKARPTWANIDKSTSSIADITTKSHTALSDIGTNTHAQIDTFIGTKAQASGLASLDGSSKVVQDPANATATPTQNKIPIADGVGGKLAAGWIPDLSGIYATAAKGVTNGDTHDHSGGDGAQIAYSGLSGLPTLAQNEAGSANNFLTAYNSTTGAFSKAQPTWANINKATSSIADITTKSHTSLTDIGTNTHAQIDSALASLSAAVGGWVALGACTYEASDDPTYTFSFASDVTTTLSTGMRINLTDSGTQYFIITNVGAFSGGKTIITGYGGTDYNLSGGAITNPFYSYDKAPVGFPLDPAKWTVVATDTSAATQASPTQNTWYNLASLSISIPIGVWRTMYEVWIQGVRASAGAVSIQVALSTANNSASDVTMVGGGQTNDVVNVSQTVHKERFLTLAAKTSYYLNTRTTATSITDLYNRGDITTTVIRAVCALL